MRLSEELVNKTKSNLEQISKLSMNQKLNVDHRGGHITVDTSTFQPISRYFSGQNRVDTLYKIIDNIELAMLVIDLLYDLVIFKKMIPDESCNDALLLHYSSRLSLYRDLIDLLNKSKSGLNSLVMTYNVDAIVRSKFSDLSKTIEIFVAKHIEHSKSI